MAFRKRFPKDIPTSPYPQWEAVELSKEQEEQLDETVRQENISLMKQCLSDAKLILKEKELKDYQTNVVQMAVALFEKRSSHLAYHKEEFAYDQFIKNS